MIQHISKPYSIDNYVITEPEDYVEPTQEQLVAEMKQAVREVNLAKQGKLHLLTLNEFLNEL